MLTGFNKPAERVSVSCARRSEYARTAFVPGIFQGFVVGFGLTLDPGARA